MALESLTDLCGKTRSVLSLCFCKLTPLSEELELQLWNLQLAQQRLLSAAYLREIDNLLGWTGITAGLSGFLDEIHESLSSSVDAQQSLVLHGDSSPKALPFYTHLFHTVYSIVAGTSSRRDLIEHGDAGSDATGDRVFLTVDEAVDCFFQGSSGVNAASQNRSIVNTEGLDNQDRKSYADLIRQSLALKMRDALRRILACYGIERGELLLAAYWIFLSTESVAICRETVLKEVYSEDLEREVSQAFLDTIKAAIAIRRLDSPESNDCPKLLRLLVSEIEQAILGQLNLFYGTIFSVPNYLVLHDRSSHSIALPWATPPRPRHQSEPLTALAPSDLSLRTSSPSYHGVHRDTEHGHQSATYLPFEGRAENSEKMPSADPWPTGPKIHAWTLSELAADAAPRNDKGKGKALDPGALDDEERDAASHIRKRSSLFVPRNVNDEGYIGRDAMVAPSAEVGSSTAASLFELPSSYPKGTVLPRPPRDRSTGLQVTMLEQASIYRNIEQINMESGEEELLNNEYAPDGRSAAPFNNGIVAIVKKPKSSRRTEHSCRLRLFRHTIMKTLHIWTELEIGDMKPLRLVEHRFETNTDFVPMYAFEEDSAEDAEVYFRVNGRVDGYRYRFDLSPHGPRILHGFQGAVLGMVFKGEFRPSKVTFVTARGIKSKNEILTAPRLQFWTDRDPQLGEVSSEDQPSSNTSSNQSGPSEVMPKDMTADFLDEYKNGLGCSRLFIYSTAPRSAIYVMFIDDRVVIKERTGFANKSQDRQVTLEPNRSSGIDRLRMCELAAQFPGIPLSLNGLQYADQDGESFNEYRNVQVEFRTEEEHKKFRTTLKLLKKEWDERLAPARKAKQHQRDPHFRIRSEIITSESSAKSILDS